MKALLIKQQDKILPKRTYTNGDIVDWIMFELKGATRKGLVVPGVFLKSGQLCIIHGDSLIRRERDEFLSRSISKPEDLPSRPLMLKSRLQILSDIIDIPNEDSDFNCYWFTEDSIFELAEKDDVIHELKSAHMPYGDILIAKYDDHHGANRCGMYWHYEPHNTHDHWTPILCEDGYHGQPVYRTK